LRAKKLRETGLIFHKKDAKNTGRINGRYHRGSWLGGGGENNKKKKKKKEKKNKKKKKKKKNNRSDWGKEKRATPEGGLQKTVHHKGITKEQRSRGQGELKKSNR